jgi:hypothetical protein
MATVQFRNDPKGIDITKRMGAPKKATMKAWFQESRKLIPQIPSPRDTDWFIYHEEATVKWIKYELQNSVGERCYVVIDRTTPGF